MKQTTFATLLAGVLTVGLLLVTIGCSDDEQPTTPEESAEIQIQSVAPPDGAQGVSPSAAISIKFSGPVDTMSIMNNFHFVGGDPMHQWRDSLDHFGGFGMMGMGHTNHMMTWMDSIHLGGEFHWNETMDSCEFWPDSLMSSDTDYLCLLNEGGMRGHNGGMMGGEQHEDSGYHMFQFTVGSGMATGPRLLSFTPADQAADVDRNPMITLTFDMPMDTHSVMSNFHLSGGAEMLEWMDSLEHHQGTGGMGMVDMGQMMGWMDEFEQGGVYHWNDNMDSCQFVPDDTLMPMTDYMIFLNGDVHCADGHLMDMHHLDYDGHMTQFRTGP